MSNFARLKRVVRSWTGSLKKRRAEDYTSDDSRIIITEFWLHLSQDGMEFMLKSDARRDSFLQAVYELEEDLDMDIIVDNRMIDPELKPRAYEEEELIFFTIEVDGEEILLAEFPLKPADDSFLH